MDKVLLVLHLMIAAGLVGVVLLQRSEGGGLGMGGGSGSFMTGRGSANLLTRTTAALAAAFFVTSIGLTVIARQGTKQISPLDMPALNVPAPVTPAGSAPKALPTPAAPAPAGGVVAPLPATPTAPPGATPVPDKALTPAVPPPKQ